MDTLRIGLIGFGYMGKMHSFCYQNLQYYYRFPHPVKIELYALATTSQGTGLPVEFTKIYHDYRELIQDEKVDVVDICAPNFMHKDILLAAIRANKAIFCEKPLALNLTEAKEVVEAMEASNYRKTNRIAFEYRFSPAVLRAKELIEEGRLGDLIQFNVKYYGSEFLDPKRPISWQSTKDKAGGGVTYALGTHAIDLIEYLVGPVEQVYAFQKTVFKERPIKGTHELGRMELEDIMNVLCQCRGDIPGTLLLSQVAAGAGIDFSFEIYGKKGAVKFNQATPNTLWYFDDTLPKAPHGGYSGYQAIETMQKYDGDAIFPPPRVDISWSRYHMASIYDFVKAVVENRESAPSLWDAFQVQRVTDAIFASAREKKIRTVETGVR